jgi:tetratricopeptide (TPR) repeat protein
MAQLRRLGLLGAEGQGYRFRDLVACRVVAGLLDAGASVRQVREALAGARRVAPDADSPLAEVRFRVEASRVIVERDRQRFEARTGQGLLDFPDAELARQAAESLSWGMVRPLVPPPRAVEAWFARAAAWDGDPERWEEAVDAYEQVLAIDPGYAAAWNNLGLLQHRMGHYERAGDCYRAAFDAGEVCPQAAFNLGSLHEDLGDLGAAIAWYRRALEIEPDYADAHFNLAGVLGKSGRAAAAAQHWRRYLELDLGSPWAEIARSHLDDIEATPEGQGRAAEAEE